jgi:hypothetical protein
MLEVNIAMLVGWFVGCFIVGFGGAWLKDRYKKRKVGTKPEEIAYEAPVLVKGTDHSTTPQMRIGFIDAMNGRILEVSTQIPHPGVSNHYDWKTEMYVIPEGQKLSEAISTVMLMKGLEK